MAQAGEGGGVAKERRRREKGRGWEEKDIGRREGKREYGEKEGSAKKEIIHVRRKGTGRREGMEIRERMGRRKEKEGRGG